jgi:hypothetical protein
LGADASIEKAFNIILRGKPLRLYSPVPERLAYKGRFTGQQIMAAG